MYKKGITYDGRKLKETVTIEDCRFLSAQVCRGDSDGK